MSLRAKVKKQKTVKLMSDYRPYNVYNPRRAPEKVTRRVKLSPRQVMWLSLICLLLSLAVRIDISERAHAKAAAEQASARRVAAVAKLNAQFKQIAADNYQLDLNIATSDVARSQTAEYRAFSAGDAASTAKVLSAALYLNQVEKNHQNLNHAIGGYPAKQALQLMVQQSDDTMWADINDDLGHPALQGYAHGLGLYSYDADSNTISATDMTRFLTLLYKGDLLNSAHTAMLMDYMQHTNREDFISPAVNSNYSFYHKVGLDGDQVNDVAIISGHDDAIAISIFTNGNGSYDWAARAKLIQKITHLTEQAYFN